MPTEGQRKATEGACGQMHGDDRMMSVGLFTLGSKGGIDPPPSLIEQIAREKPSVNAKQAPSRAAKPHTQTHSRDRCTTPQSAVA